MVTYAHVCHLTVAGCANFCVRIHAKGDILYFSYSGMTPLVEIYHIYFFLCAGEALFFHDICIHHVWTKSTIDKKKMSQFIHYSHINIKGVFFGLDGVKNDPKISLQYSYSYEIMFVVVVLEVEE